MKAVQLIFKPTKSIQCNHRLHKETKLQYKQTVHNTQVQTMENTCEEYAVTSEKAAER